MADLNADDVVLKLALKMMDPAEARRLAHAGSEAIEAEIRASIMRQEEAFRAFNSAMTDETRKAAKDQIKETTAQTKQLSQALKEVEKASRDAQGGVAAFLTKERENLKAVAATITIGRAAWDIIGDGFERFKSLGESISRTQEIYGSLKGSIDALRESTGGEVSDMDLIISKNQATQLELKLTDEQMRIVGAGAKLLSQGIGEDTTHALQQMIEGLATGKTKSLELMGALDSSKKAIQDYADRHGLAVKALSEHQERVAKLEGALRTLDRKLVESGGDAETFANQWQVAGSHLKNTWDEIQLEAGGAIKSIVDFLTVDLPDALAVTVLTMEKAAAKFKVGFLTLVDPLNLFTKEAKEEARLSVQAATKAMNDYNQMVIDAQRSGSEERAKAVAAAQKRLADKTGKAYNGENAVGGDRTPTEIPYSGKTPGLDNLFNVGEEAAAKRMNDIARAAELTFAILLGKENTAIQNFKDALRLAGLPGGEGGEILGDRDMTLEEIAAGNVGAIARRAGTDQAVSKLLGVRDVNSVGEGEAGTQKDDLAEQEKRANRIREMLKSIGDQFQEIGEGSGIFERKQGFISQFLYGDEDPEEVLARMGGAKEEMIAFGNDLHDTFGGVGQAMAGAFGKSLAAAIGEGQGFQRTLKDQTHAVLMSLSEQAFVKSALWGAEALGDLAMGNFAGAAAAGAASAAFASVGVLAGGLARATYSAPSASSGSPLGSSYRGSGGSGPSTLESSSGQSGQTTVTNIINIDGVLPGQEDQIWETILQGLKKNQSRTGNDIVSFFRS